MFSKWAYVFKEQEVIVHSNLVPQYQGDKLLLCELISIKVNVINTSHNDILELSGKKFSKMKFNGSKCRLIYIGGKQ